MFWTEEDIQPAVNAATEVFGPQAQYHTGVFSYISVETPKFGPIWYGDYPGDTMAVSALASVLSSKINESVIIRDLGTSNIIST